MFPWSNIEGFLLTMDIEKGFGSLDRMILISVFKKIEFCKTFITWIEILSND